MRLWTAIFVLLAGMAGAAVAQPPEPAENRVFEEVYLAKDDGFGKPGEAATEFLSSDIPIYCVVVLSNASAVTVKMDLIAVSVAGVKPGHKVISTSYLTKDLQDRVFFNGKPHGMWTAGVYRADIYIEGNLVGKFPFRIKNGDGAGKPGVTFPKQPVKTRTTTAKKT